MRLLPAILATCVFSSPVLAAKHAAPPPDPCIHPAEQLAFDIEGLKSELMVTALACKAQDKYNVFMRAYQSDVAHEEKDLTTYFKRGYGRASQKEYDEYISNLANVQEQDGLKAGTAFCDNLPAMFDEVMSLHNASELPDYARSQAIAQPVALSNCPAVPEKAAAPAKTRRARAAKHKSA